MPLYACETTVTDDQVADVVAAGNPARQWSGLPILGTSGNFYKTFQVLPNNVGPQAALYFRTFTRGDTPQQDLYGQPCQATHFHVPLISRDAAPVGEYVTGFAIAGDDMTVKNYGLLKGMTTAFWYRTVVFSETTTFPALSGIDPAASTSTNAAPMPASLATALLPFLRTGHQLYWNADTEAFVPYRPHWVGNSKMYFMAGSTKYRALVFYEAAMALSDQSTQDCPNMIVGFGVEHGGSSLRGFGQLATFSAAAVSFTPVA